MGKVMAVANQKGGVGKTTTAVNLAASLGAMGKKCLLVDIDPQGNATSGFGVNKKALAHTAYELFAGEATAAQVVVHTPFAQVDLIPASMELAGAEIQLVEQPHREQLLKNALAPLRDQYRYVIIDCPPSLGLVTLNGLCATDTVLVPIQCEYYALEGLSQLMATIRQVKRLYNSQIDVEGVLLTMYDGRLKLTYQVVQEVKKYFPRKVFKTVIPRNVALSEAPSYGSPAYYYEKGAKGSRAYWELAQEIAKANGDPIEVR